MYFKVKVNLMDLKCSAGEKELLPLGKNYEIVPCC